MNTDRPDHGLLLDAVTLCPPDRHIDAIGPALKSMGDGDGWMFWQAWLLNYCKKDWIRRWDSVSALPAPEYAPERIFDRAITEGWRGLTPAGKTWESRANGWRRQVNAAEQRTRRQREAETAAEQARDMIGRAQYGPHPYLSRKGFEYEDNEYLPPPPGSVGLVLDGYLLLPMRDVGTGEITAVQRIDADGNKRFMPAGCRVSGSVLRLGRRRSPGWYWWVEGYATGLSVLGALRHFRGQSDQVVVCFSAANLVKVAKTGIVIADNDASGVGENAAIKTGLPYWMPPDAGTDANDYEMNYGGDMSLADRLREVYLACRPLTREYRTA